MTITCDSPTTHFGSGCELLLYYDGIWDGIKNGIITSNDVSVALDDAIANRITEEEFVFVNTSRQDGSINTSCPTCYIEGGRPPPCSDYGDVDGDGYVTSVDAQMVTQHIVGTITLTPDQFIRADVNGDGNVSGVDKQLIQQYVAGTIDTFPVCSEYPIFQVIEFTLPTTCTVPCNIDIHIKWQNVGTTVGSFIPKYAINGIPYTVAEQTLAPNATYTLDDVVSIASAGTYEICPYPNE